MTPPLTLTKAQKDIVNLLPFKRALSSDVPLRDAMVTQYQAMKTLPGADANSAIPADLVETVFKKLEAAGVGVTDEFKSKARQQYLQTDVSIHSPSVRKKRAWFNIHFLRDIIVDGISRALTVIKGPSAKQITEDLSPDAVLLERPLRSLVNVEGKQVTKDVYLIKSKAFGGQTLRARVRVNEDTMAEVEINKPAKRLHRLINQAIDTLDGIRNLVKGLFPKVYRELKGNLSESLKVSGSNK